MTTCAILVTLIGTMTAASLGSHAAAPAAVGEEALPPKLTEEQITGVYALSAGGAPNAAMYDLNIAGIAIRTYWRDIEPAKGEYDWSLFDEVVEAARDKNKVVKLFVLFGSGVPEWVGAKWITGNPDARYDAGGARIPVPWDENLLRESKTFIETFAARYRNEPHVAYFHVAGPSALWAELALPDNLQEQEGFSNETILNCWKRNIDLWNEVRGNKRLSCSISAAPAFYDNLGADIAAYAVGASDKVDDHGAVGPDFTPQWCYLDAQFARSIRQVSATWAPKTLIGWQMWGATVWPTRRTTDYDATMDLARDVNSTFIEVYTADLVIPELAAYAEKINREMQENLAKRKAGESAAAAEPAM